MQRRRMPVWRPVLVNLALGVPAVIPLYCAWWLLTRWVPMDCESIQEVTPGFEGSCNFTTLDHGPVVMAALAVTGLPLLALLVVFDVWDPLARKQRLGPWLGSVVLLLVPFGALYAAAQL